MIGLWRSGERRLAMLAVMVWLVCRNLNLCYSLNDEGLSLLRFRERVVSDPFGALSNWNDDFGVINPCSWFGVECRNGNVVALNLKDLCLGGTLAPDLGDLVHIKSIILRNNCFTGIIPEELGELKELEVLDLGYNNFSGEFPSKLGNNLSLTVLLLDNNEFSHGMSPEIHELIMLSEVQVDESQLSNIGQRSSCNKRSILWSAEAGNVAQRQLLETDMPKRNERHSPTSSTPAVPPPISPSPTSPEPIAPSPSLSGISTSPVPSTMPTARAATPSPSVSAPPHLDSTPNTSAAESGGSSKNQNRVIILYASIGGSALLFILVIGIFLCRGNKVASVKPWATGISGQLQKAFVTGVPKLKRSELETACEDFSNVIGSSSTGTIFKGTLSSGVEISVISVAVSSAKDWSKNLEAQFRSKIDTLSKVNHKNFVNLIGYCVEEGPFTRMLVFEYAPNGTLFEHLHIKEAEHLDWGMRMRIAMGMAYCLEHMHQLTPPISHRNLNSSAVNLTEDYAAKISDFSFWNELAAAEEVESHPPSNVYSFGVILFEMMTGRLPYSVDNGSLEDWASDYVRGEQPLREIVDPTLQSFLVEQLEQMGEVIKSCVHPDPQRRPTMREVTSRLREITAIGPDGAIPKLSPLWWAELEILSTDAA